MLYKIYTISLSGMAPTSDFFHFWNFRNSKLTKINFHAVPKFQLPEPSLISILYICLHVSLVIIDRNKKVLLHSVFPELVYADDRNENQNEDQNYD
jgi:hypothetical protein